MHCRPGWLLSWELCAWASWVPGATATAVDKLLSCPTQLTATTSHPSPPSWQYITLLFTDLGVLTPAAVSDELIQLYV